VSLLTANVSSVSLVVVDDAAFNANVLVLKAPCAALVILIAVGPLPRYLAPAMEFALENQAEAGMLLDLADHKVIGRGVKLPASAEVLNADPRGCPGCCKGEAHLGPLAGRRVAGCEAGTRCQQQPV
jgi:hypothetical protein